MGDSSVEGAVIPRLWDEDPDHSPTGQTNAAGAWSQSRDGSGTRARVMVKRHALTMLAGWAVGRLFPIRTAKVTIGRSNQATFTLEDEGISRMHCGISHVDGVYFLSDLGSTNGTLVNGCRAERVALAPGDHIQIGPDTVLRFDVYDELGGGAEGLGRKVHEAATRDLLTGALNRRELEERLSTEVAYATRHDTKLVAIKVELDVAAVLALGHSRGDVLLCEAATMISSVKRREDLFARTGDACFVVLCRDLTLQKGETLAARISNLVSARIGVSVGVAELGETTSLSASQVLRSSDLTSGDSLLALARTRLSPAGPALEEAPRR